MNRENTNQLFELNPDHTHFIVVDDDCDTDSLNSFRFALEMRFTKPVGRPRRYRSLFTHGKYLKCPLPNKRKEKKMARQEQQEIQVKF